MREVIAEKLNEIRQLKPHDPQLRKWLRDSDLWYWLYTVLRLTGRPLGRQQIVSILSGELDESVPLGMYEFVHGCAAVYKDMEECRQMQSSPDFRLLKRWQRMAFGEEKGLRDTNPVVYQWNYVPPHFREVPVAMNRLFRDAAAHVPEDLCERTAELACGLLALYPYGEDSMVMAGFMVMYELIEAGVPLPSLTVGEQEFNEMMAAYLDTGDSAPITEMCERSLLNRLEAVLQVLRQAMEVN